MTQQVAVSAFLRSHWHRQVSLPWLRNSKPRDSIVRLLAIGCVMNQQRQQGLTALLLPQTKYNRFNHEKWERRFSSAFDTAAHAGFWTGLNNFSWTKEPTLRRGDAASFTAKIPRQASRRWAIAGRDACLVQFWRCQCRAQKASFRSLPRNQCIEHGELVVRMPVLQH